MFRYLTLSTIVGPRVVNINFTMDLILKESKKIYSFTRKYIIRVLKKWSDKTYFFSCLPDEIASDLPNFSTNPTPRPHYWATAVSPRDRCRLLWPHGVRGQGHTGASPPHQIVTPFTTTSVHINWLLEILFWPLHMDQPLRALSFITSLLDSLAVWWCDKLWS